MGHDLNELKGQKWREEVTGVEKLQKLRGLSSPGHVGHSQWQCRWRGRLDKVLKPAWKEALSRRQMVTSEGTEVRKLPGLSALLWIGMCAATSIS